MFDLRTVDVCKFSKELLGRFIVSACRFLGRTEPAKMFVSPLDPNTSNPTTMTQRNAFQLASVLHRVCRILSGSYLAKITTAIIERVVVSVVSIFSTLTSENFSVHQNSSFRSVGGTFSIKSSGIFVPMRDPVPLGQPVKIFHVNNRVLIARQRDKAIRFIERLGDLMTFHPKLHRSGKNSLWHWSSLQGLLRLSRYCITPVVLLSSAIVTYSQNPSVIQPNCQFGFTFTAAGRSVAQFQNITPGTPSKTCTSWTMVYSSTGFSALSIELDSAPDAGATPGVSPGSWTIWPTTQIAAGQTLPLTSTTNAGITMYGFFPWVSVNLNSVTGTGTIVGVVYGWQTQGSQESNTGATQTQGVIPNGSAPTVGNSVQIALNAPTKPFVCFITLSSLTTTQCQAAPGAGLRNYISSFLIQTNTAGTATTLNLAYGTGSNCGTGTTALSASFANTATNTASPANLSPLSPWQPAANTAVCVTQAGTTTGNSVVELHGFVAP